MSDRPSISLHGTPARRSRGEGGAKTDHALSAEHIPRSERWVEVTGPYGTVRDGPKRRGMAGPDRAVLYRLAAETGLRASEIASLTPAISILDDLDEASVKVTAAHSKHRREDVVPMRRDLAEITADHIEAKGKRARERLFVLNDHAAEMIREDLDAARTA